jgi:O-antigen ligase
LAVLLGALLPWSTSIFLILLVPFLLIVCVSVDVDAFRRSFSRAPSLVSVGFLILAIAGLFWSEATWSDGSRALGSVVKFLALPFFLYYFALSKRSAWVFGSFLLSCTLLMIYSWVVTFEPAWALKTGRCCGQDYGVPVRNYIDQGQEFSACLVALISAGLYGLKERVWKSSAALCFVALLFAANLVFVVTSRTALVCIPVMLSVVAWRHARMRGLLVAIGLGGLSS